MQYLFASLMVGVGAVSLAVAGLPSDSTETECHGARKGSIVAIANCPDMPERLNGEPAHRAGKGFVEMASRPSSTGEASLDRIDARGARLIARQEVAAVLVH